MLRGIGKLYASVLQLRNRLYERGSFKSHALPAPTISVGNITVGGTGKTPLVKFLAEHLISRGYRVCILSRGYKRNSKERVLVSDGRKVTAGVEESGDEPFELATLLGGRAIVISDKNRVESARFAAENFAPDVFLLDDAFQHRKVARDLDIVVVDATNPFGNEKTLPDGILRESLENLSRADVAVISRSDLSDDVSNIESRIKSFAPEIPILRAKGKLRGFVEIKSLGKEEASRVDQEMRLLAFCGLGNPDNFFGFLRKNEVEIARTKKFPDHHTYTLENVNDLNNELKEAGADAFVTTAKDAVKLKEFDFQAACMVCLTDMSFEKEKSLTDIVDKAILRKKA